MRKVKTRATPQRAVRRAATWIAMVCGVAAMVGSGSGPAPRDRDGTPPKPDGGNAAGDPLVLSQPASATAGFAWKGMEEDFKVPRVLCNAVNIGRLDFKYRPYCDTGFNRDAGGAALEGGFTANGNDPCLFGQKLGTEYFWIQTIITSQPLPGRGPGEYVDSNNPRRDPAYPFQATDNNPANNPFTDRSYYDAPRRGEKANTDISWLAENMLCCRNDGKINVIGSFLWGFDITADGMPNDGNVNVTANGRHAWGPATDSAVDTVANEARGTKTEAGWTVRRGCCCNLLLPFKGFSDALGFCICPVTARTIDVVLDLVLVFPRNHPVVDFETPGAPGWTTQPWGSDVAPVLPYQVAGTQMFQQGVLFVALKPQPGPVEIDFQFQLANHESFFDVFLHDAVTGTWLPWVVNTQELLADMDGDNLLTPDDLNAWDLAFTAPDVYQEQFPGLNPIFRGDLSHDRQLALDDRALLEEVLFTILNTDANGPLLCPPDVNGDGVVNVLDLIDLLLCFGQPAVPGCVGEDVNGDGTVNVLDLIDLLLAFGTACP